MPLTVIPSTHGAPRLTGAATAAPPLTITQTDAKAAARALFAGMPGLERLLSVFDNAGVEVRQVVMPAADLIGRTAASLRHQDYVRCALPLLAEASRAALTQAGVKASDITHVVLVSSTGLANPTLDVRLAPELGLSPGVRRVPLWGLGCGGGAQGLSVAADLARSAPGARVLLMLVELCSLTLVPSDLTPGNLVAAALFGDGAAAAVVENGAVASRKAGIDILDAEAARIENTLGAMGWTIADDGWRVVFSTEIPSLVKTHAPRATAALLGRHGLTIGDIARHVLHPGGPAVLDAYEEALGLSRSATAAARSALAFHGNCSSVSLFHALDEALPREGPRVGRDGEPVLFSAFGPGFCAEVALGRVVKP